MIGFILKVNAKSNSPQSKVYVCTPQMFWANTRSSEVVDTHAQIRDYYEQHKRGEISDDTYKELYNKEKAKLPAITPHAIFSNGRRSNSEAIPTGLAMLDIDHVNAPEHLYTERLEGRETKLGICLVHCTPSLEGLRVIFRIPKGMDIPQAQQWMATQMDIADQYDKAPKDLARCSFMVPEMYIYFINESLLFGSLDSSAENTFSEKGTQKNPTERAPRNVVCQGERSEEKGSNSSIPNSRNKESEAEKKSASTGCGVATNGADRDNAEKQSTANAEKQLATNAEKQSTTNAEKQSTANAGKQSTANAEKQSAANAGKQLAINATGTAYKPESLAQLFLQPAPTLSVPNAKPFEEVKRPFTPNTGSSTETAEPSFKGIPYSRIIHEWFALNGGVPEKGERNQKLFTLCIELRTICDDNQELMLSVVPKFGLGEAEVRQLIHSACKEEYRRSMHKGMKLAVERAQAAENKSKESGNELPPSLPEVLPSLIALLVSRTPEIYKATVAQTIWASLGANMRCRFEYIDGVEKEPIFMCVTIAPTGSGKSCIIGPIDMIMEYIREDDRKNLQCEKKWKEEVNSMGSNKKKPERPKITVQEISADATSAAFIMRLAEADGHILYCMMNEIGQLNALKSNSYGGQFDIICLSFDTGLYGQTRVGTQSVSERVRMRFNFNASTTPTKAKDYFAKALIGGPISRINFSTIPPREIGAEMPVYGKYDDAFREQLKPYMENLRNASGLIECPQAKALARQLVAECSEYAVVTQDAVWENLSFRANVITYLKGCVLYVANGCVWEESFNDFLRWSLHYDLWVKMHYFGEDIRRAENEGEMKTQRSGPRNLLHHLSKVFTFREVVELRRRLNLSEEGTKNMLHTWSNRGYIKLNDDGSYANLRRS